MAENVRDYWLITSTVTYAAAAGTHTVAEIPAGTFVDNVVLLVTTAFAGTSPTLDVGDEDNDDTFVDNSDVTATSTGDYAARAGASADCTLKNGNYYSAAKRVTIKIGGTSLTAGVARALLHCVDVSNFD